MNHDDIIIKDGDAMSDQQTTKRFSRKKKVIGGMTIVGLCAAGAAIVPLGGGNSSAFTGESQGILCSTQFTDTGSHRAYTITAKDGYTSEPDGNAVYDWGFSDDTNFRLPGPVLCVHQGQTVDITLHNQLTVDTSIQFPGQEGVTYGSPAAPVGPVTDNSHKLLSLVPMAGKNGGSQTYSFTASKAGTFLYQSGTDPQFQVQMGLFGAIVVYPNITVTKDDILNAPTDDPTTPGGVKLNKDIVDTQGHMTDGQAQTAADAAGCAYASITDPTKCDPNAIFEKDRENILLLSEVDPGLHGWAEQNKASGPSMDTYPGAYEAHYYMINGRSMPDTIAPNNAPWLPGQPMGALATVEPWDLHVNPLDAMLRYVSVGVTGYDFHPHSNHEHVIATDASLMKAVNGSTVDNNTEEKFNIMVSPGATVDATFRWTNEEGYSNTDGKRVPVEWPTGLNLTEGDFWSGSPYLGSSGKLNPGILTKTQCGEYYHVAHSHDLTQVTNYGITFGGMLTLIKVEPPQSVQDVNGKCNG